jgi:hypothetical protein
LKRRGASGSGATFGSGATDREIVSGQAAGDLYHYRAAHEP